MYIYIYKMASGVVFPSPVENGAALCSPPPSGLQGTPAPTSCTCSRRRTGWPPPASRWPPHCTSWRWR